jgi:CDP-glucose 4,6-dehydratase
MSYLKNCFKNKKVIVTGHTGFKGAWLSFWLMQLGAKVTGVSIAKTTKPSIFEVLGIQKRLKNKFIDIRNLKRLKFIVSKEKPDFIFHLAAQALVKKSYKDPIETITTNSIGTMNILESLKAIKKKNYSYSYH